MLRFLLIALFAFALGLMPASAHLRFIAYATAQTTDSTSATPTAIAGLAMPIRASGTLLARCSIASTSANAATGIRYAVTGPASPASVTLTVETWTTTAKLEERYAAANYSFVSAAVSSILTERQINTMTLLIINGATAGTVQLTINPSASNQVTAEVGSVCEYTYLDVQP